MIQHPQAPAPHPVQPVPPQLDDGFSPPSATVPDQDAASARAEEPVNPALWAKSDF